MILVLTSAGVQRLGLIALAVLFGFAAVLGGIELWRGRPARRGTTYWCALVSAGLFGYLLLSGGL